MSSIMSDTELNLLRAAKQAEKWIAGYVKQMPIETPYKVLTNLRTSILESERGALGDENGPYRCEVTGCDGLAEWSGWNRRLDPVIGTPSGLIQRRCVYEEHKHLLLQRKEDDDAPDA